jgi:hypothetical protein
MMMITKIATGSVSESSMKRSVCLSKNDTIRPVPPSKEDASSSNQNLGPIPLVKSINQAQSTESKAEPREAEKKIS